MIVLLFLTHLLLSIHSGGVISATLMNEGTVRCGNLLCRPVVGVFTDNPLQEGYSLVATIPIGSSNISITELKHSANRLAIRSMDDTAFAINGDDTEPTDSGTFEIADALFDYRQIGPDESNQQQSPTAAAPTAVTEWITSTGPISSAIEVMVLAFDRNPGIKFEYLVPTVTTNANLPPTSDEYSYDSSESLESNSVLPKSSPTRLTVSAAVPSSTTTTTTTTTTTPFPSVGRPRRKRRFAWKVTGYGECSKTCGGGFKMPVIRCVREKPLRIFVPKKCAHLPRPDATEHMMRCNSHACPGYWKVGEWSSNAKCECTMTATHHLYQQKVQQRVVLQKRDVKCVQELGSGLIIQIPSAACTEQRPIDELPCPPCLGVHETSASRGSGPMMVADQAPTIISKPLRRPRPHLQQLQHHNHNQDDADRGVWLASAWSKDCSTDCNADSTTHIEHRTIFCDRLTKFSKRCELSRTPETSQQCQQPNASSSACTRSEWLIGSWSKCSGDCFNLTQTRTVACVQHVADSGSHHIVLASRSVACEQVEPRPLELRECSADDVSHCQPQWHYSAWSECTKPCASGSQRRTVKCVRPVGGAMKESDDCKYVDRLPIYQTCNTHPCPSVSEVANDQAPADLIQNDTECTDNLPNCKMVQQQHLCNNEYFHRQCCYTCS